MNILAIDDEIPALNFLIKSISLALPNAKIHSFDDALDGIEFSKSLNCDIAFLDIEMPEIDGLTLAKELKNINPKINIVFVTGYSHYAISAFSARASDYLLKPVTPEAILKAVSNLRNPISLTSISRIRIQTFGNFEIFVDDKPVIFKRQKAKEVLAFLVDRKGANVKKKEIAGILWEDQVYNRDKQIQLQVIISELIRALTQVNAQDILIRSHSNFAININNVDCDYYRFCAGDTSAINAYTGEYMSNYSWAEFTAGFIFEKMNKN